MLHPQQILAHVGAIEEHWRRLVDLKTELAAYHDNPQAARIIDRACKLLDEAVDVLNHDAVAAT